jgi:hypothetical protein
MPLVSVRTVPRDVWAVWIVAPLPDVPVLGAAALGDAGLVLDGAELVLDGVALGAAALLLPLLQAAAASAAVASGTARIHRRTTQLRACVRSAGIGDLLASLPVPSAWSPAQLFCSLP